MGVPPVGVPGEPLWALPSSTELMLSVSPTPLSPGPRLKESLLLRLPGEREK